MAKKNNKVKTFFGYIWQFIKEALPSMLMYLCAGTVLLMVMFKTEDSAPWSNTNAAWTVGALLVVAAYNALMAWAHGGSHYEMLVSGNIKRSTADMYGSEYKISSHKLAKEYRPWKGFVIGAVIGIIPVITGIAFGLSYAPTDTKLGGGALVGFILSGWSVLPIFSLNQGGANISYFVSCIFAILPIVVTGVFYICGAYARRNKAVREQMIADKAAEAEANKPKKINYGGLPGTKPKKKK